MVKTEGTKSERKRQHVQKKNSVPLCRRLPAIVRLGETTAGASVPFRAFTLVELLVVISILAILMGIVLPGFYTAKKRAREMEAKVNVKNLESAFKAYLDHYKVWPVGWIGSEVNPVQDKYVKALRGEDVDNPDKIVFYEFKYLTNSAMDPDKAYDTYSNPNDQDNSKWRTYYVAFDDNYNNVIFEGQPHEVRRSVVVWSVGENREQDYGLGDDIASWR